VDFSSLNSQRISDLGVVGDGVELAQEFLRHKETDSLRPDFFDEFRQWLDSINPLLLHSSKDVLGSSSLTFLSMMCYINKHRPKTVIIENVRNAPWNTMCNLFFRAVGYKAKYKFLDTKDFYIPQTRSRTYAVAVDCELIGAKAAENMVDMWAKQLDKLRRPASSPVRDWLLAPNDAFTLKARQDESEKTIASGLNPNKTKPDKWVRSGLRHARLRRDIGVGHDRPFTGWGKPGITLPYDRIDRLLLKSLGTRALDCMDIYYFRCILPGDSKKPGEHYDVRFKSQIIDVSQNIDRGRPSTQFGITGCLTPRGINLITNQGRLVSGFEALKLQGLPLRDLDLTRESQEQLRDLAGNAMSSTVVGAGILSLILALHKHFPGKHRGLLPPVKSEYNANREEKALMPLDHHCTQQGDNTEKAYDDVRAVLDLAKQCRRYCYCNGGAKYSTDKLQQCVVCDTIRCANCAGNPAHTFQHFKPIENPIMNDMVPHEIMKRFPTAITHIIDESVEQLQLRSGSTTDSPESQLVHALRSALFAYTKVLVSEEVTICYSAQDGKWSFKLQAVIAEKSLRWYLLVDPWFGHGQQLCKYLGIKPQHLSQPLGRQVVLDGTKSYLPGRRSWEFWSFTAVSFKVSVTRTNDASVDVLVSGIDSAPSQIHGDLESISGTYKHHPECDAAENSLHVSVDQTNPGGRQRLYLFKDTACLGPAKEDCFVISDSSRVLEKHERRDLVVSFPPEWTPQSAEASVKALVKGYWQMAVEAHNGTTQFASTPSVGSQYISPIDHLPAINQGHRGKTLASVKMVVNTLDENYAMLWKYQSDRPAWTAVGRSDYTAVFDLLAPANVKLHGVEGSSQLESEDCVTCSPPEPDIHWVETLMPKGKKGYVDVRRPYRLSDDVRCFREALKIAGDPFRVMLNIKPNGGSSSEVTANYEINVDMIQHRARSYLPTLKSDRQQVGAIITRIDIKKESLNSPNLRFESFDNSLKALDQDGVLQEFRVPFVGGLRLSKSQMYSLAWMIRQECDPPAFAERESEECTINDLNLSITATAQRNVKVRGGALADDVGYGKTVVSLALMGAQRASDEHEAHILRSTNNTNTLVLAATLVIAPSHLVDQWESEIKKFLGWSGHDILTIKSTDGLQISLGSGPAVVSSANGQKRRRTAQPITVLDKMKAAKVIIVNKKVLCDKYYVELGKYAGSLAHPPGLFKKATAAPIHPNELGAFQDWYEDALIHARVHVDGYNPLIFNTDRIQTVNGRQKRLLTHWGYVRDDYEKTTPERFEWPKIKDSKGSQSLQEPKYNPLQEEDFVDKNGFLLLEAFRFSRLIFDEASYTNFFSSLFVKNAQAGSKWVLSATPPTDNLQAVCELATTLNVHVARPVKLRPGIPLIAEGPVALAHDSTEEQLSYSRLFSDRSITGRVEQGHKFLAHFASANPFDEVGLGKIPVTEQVYCSRMTRSELARYIDVQTEFQSQNSETKTLAKRHQIDLTSLDHEDPLYAGYALAYVASVECGGTWGGVGDLIERRRKRLIAAEADLKRIMDVALWLIARRSEEIKTRTTRQKPNPSVISIVEDLARFIRDIVSGTAETFGGVESLEAVVHSLFGSKGIPAHLTEDAPDEVLLSGVLTSQNAGIWKYFKFDADIVKRIREEDQLELLAELQPVDQNVSGAKALKDLMHHLAEREEREEAERAAKAKRFSNRKTTKPRQRNDQGTYPILFEPRKLRSVNYSATEAEICDIILEINIAKEAVAVAAKQLTAAQTLFDGVDSPACNACESTSGPLVFVPGCGHFICKSHENIEACGHIKSRKYPNGSGCSALLPKRLIPIEQIRTCFMPMNGGQKEHSSKTRHIVNAIEQILGKTDDSILLFWQFEKQRDEICGLLDRNRIRYVLGSEDQKTRLRFLELKSEEAAGSNLQDANHVMFVNTPIFSQQREFEKCVKQAKGRVIRYGQKKHVYVYYFVSANSFEVDLLQLRKRAFIRPRDGNVIGQNLVCYFEDWPTDEDTDDTRQEAAVPDGSQMDVDIEMEDAPSDDKP